jgi:hypothetical protein
MIERVLLMNIHHNNLFHILAIFQLKGFIASIQFIEYITFIELITFNGLFGFIGLLGLIEFIKVRAHQNSFIFLFLILKIFLINIFNLKDVISIEN